MKWRTRKAVKLWLLFRATHRNAHMQCWAVKLSRIHQSRKVRKDTNKIKVHTQVNCQKSAFHDFSSIPLVLTCEHLIRSPCHGPLASSLFFMFVVVICATTVTAVIKTGTTGRFVVLILVSERIGTELRLRAFQCRCDHWLWQWKMSIVHWS